MQIVRRRSYSYCTQNVFIDFANKNCENCTQRFMKKFLAILVLSLFLITPSQADDIRDFQIEGMSIGDSLLDYFSEEKIEEEKNSEYVFRYKDNRFVILGVGYGSAFPLSTSQKLEMYEELGVVIKPNDKSYKIYSIAGEIYCETDINICFSKKEEILSELEDFLGNRGKLHTYKDPHPIDKTGNSYVYGNEFSFKLTRDTLSVNIYDWSEKILTEKNYVDAVKLSISLEEYDKFLRNEAYK